jgi:hypothetical protein
MLDHLFDSIGLSINTTNRQTLLKILGAQPNHTLLLEASGDLLHWTTIATNSPSVVTDWQVLDTNAPAFGSRFYRAVGQSK